MPPPDRDLEESFTWWRGAFNVRLSWEGDELVARVNALGRDGDLPSNADEAAWVDAAAAMVPGVKPRSEPAWTVAPHAVDAFKDALRVEGESISLRVTRFESALLDRLADDFHASAYWDIPGGRVMVGGYGSGLVRVDHGGRFLEELQVRLGEPFGTDPFASVNDVGRARARDVLKSLCAWNPGHLSWVMIHGTPAR